MKKLIEFQEDKHGDVLEVIAQFRSEHNTTFSESVRRLILLSSNGHCAPDEANPNMQERLETIERKLEIVIGTSKKFKKYMEQNPGADQDEE